MGVPHPSDPNVDRLLEHLDQRAGDGLRTVVTYADEDYTLHYHRDDLDERTVREAIAETLGNIGRSRTRSDSLDGQLGPRRASVQLRDRGVVCHLTPRDDHRGTIVSFERHVARQLDLFSRECLQLLYE